MKEPIDKLIKEKLYDHESSVPNNLWEQVAADLDEEKEKKKPVYWHWAAVILLLIGSSLFLLKDHGQTQIVNNKDVIKTQGKEIKENLIVTAEEEECIEHITPVEVIMERRKQLVAPLLSAHDSRALAINNGDEMEPLKTNEIDWEILTPEYKEDGRVLVSVRLTKGTADKMPENKQKKNWRERIADVKNADKKIRIPKPNISLSDLFAAK